MSVCIVIPIYKERSQLTAYEEISLKQCFQVLSKYDLFFVGPKTLNWEQYLSFSKEYNCVSDVKTFPGKFFSDLGGYSRLLINIDFYNAFSNYDYLLLYQTDAFVFRDDLNYWCEKKYDYVGAPWFEGFSSTNRSAAFVPGGNGGFSLRKIATHLRVLHSFSFINPPVINWKKRMAQQLSKTGIAREVGGFILDLAVRNNTYWLLNSFRGFEDQFWCLVAAKNFSWFTIPGSLEEMNFAMEMQPRRVFELNNHQLPFGCHAWWKYDLEFWKPFISGMGYKL